MSEAVLFHALSAQRLRARARWAGIVLALAIVVPFEVVDGTPLWTWQILSELPLAAIVAALSPTLAGAAILVARARTRRPTSLAIAALASLATAAATVKIGADASAWDVLRLPSSFAERPAPALLGLALAGAGANLTFKAHARRVARALLGAAVVAIVVWYAWPARGEAPLASVARALAQIGDLPFRFQIGLLVVVGFALFPLLVVLACAAYAVWPARGEQSVAGLLATFGLPAIVVLFVYRAMLAAAGQVELVATLGGAVLVAAVLALLTSAIEVLVDGITIVSVLSEEGAELEPGLPAARASTYGAAVAAVVLATEAILARPPRKGIEWSPRPASPEAQALFEKLVPAWSASRLAWNAKVRAESGAQELVRMKAAAKAMTDAAKTVDAGVAAAVDALAHAGDELDVAGRRWHRLVAEANDASRRAGLPFYLDPAVTIHATKDGILRTFRVSSYRVEAVHPVVVAGAPFATLHVRALGGRYGHAARLGFSRDLQPFALVVLDEIEAAEQDYRELLSSDDDELRCGSTSDAAANRGLRACGEALRAVCDAKGFDLRGALVTLTERHELQHQVDGPHLALSGPVLKRMEGYAEAPQRQANRELSSYLAELTSDAPPKLGVIHMIPFALIARGGPEHHVAVIVLSSLSGRPVPKVDRIDGVDTAELASAIDDVLALDDDAIRARAAKLWADAFGRTLPRPEVTK